MSKAGQVRFNWERYLNLAEELLELIPENKDDEAKARCGISRAYYAAYHKAEAYLNEIGITIDIYQKGSHKRVIEEFHTIGRSNRLWRGVDVSLKRLKTWREAADYSDRFFDEVSNPNLTMKSILKSAIILANDVIERINKIEEVEKK